LRTRHSPEWGKGNGFGATRRKPVAGQAWRGERENAGSGIRQKPQKIAAALVSATHQKK
jgi:hypothetical protein